MASKLLNLRDAASPLTLVLDSLEQPARPLVSEFIARAKVRRDVHALSIGANGTAGNSISKTKVVFLSFATLRKPRDADVLVKAAGRDLAPVRRDLLAHLPAYDPAQAKEKPSQRAVVVIDSVNNLASADAGSLATFLSSIITPAVSIVAVYHDDVPVILPRTFNEYEPHPFTVLSHLATAILRVTSLRQEMDRQGARNRALQEPEWGLKEDREGVVIGLRPRDRGDDLAGGGVVVDMELRRRSGRTISEKFILQPSPAALASSTGRAPGKISLLTDHPMFAKPVADSGAGQGEEEPESTFNLGLTDKQRKDREGIVLPYFDAQTDIGAGEGGRIFTHAYKMIRSTQIARLDGLMLCASVDDEQSDATALKEVKQQTKQVLRKLTRTSEPQASIESGSGLAMHYLIDSDVVFLAICEQSYPRKLAFTYLADLAREFTTTHPPQQVHSPQLRPYAFMEFDNFIAKTRTTYADARAAQNLDKLNDELRDVTKVMTKNIEDLLYRGDSLEKMGEISSRLRDDSKKYRRAAVRINWELLLKQYGPFAGLGLFVLLFIYMRFF
ncbi:Protein transport protein sec22 [Purpureocillium lavendulum]|uniref:Protein transport protein SEC22 n=1 Tax=Purpureocillium lavendulum TaxID=1247861 RepID=A0AB34FII8_9HYPO|nr:Protein transport protein sec22 [Purpureocillium lavendulum]